MKKRNPIISAKITNLFEWFGKTDFIGFFFFPFIFMEYERPKYEPEQSLWDRMVNHESIHFWQCLMLLVVGFLLIFSLHYIYNLFYYRFDLNLAYRNVVFEREAYHMDDDLECLEKGLIRPFSFVKYFSKEFEYKMKSNG